jgi:phage gpG-like protein
MRQNTGNSLRNFPISARLTAVSNMKIALVAANYAYIGSHFFGPSGSAILLC